MYTKIEKYLYFDKSIFSLIIPIVQKVRQCEDLAHFHNIE